MTLAFKDRIALYYTLATAALVAAVYVVVFGVVQNRVYADLDARLRFEIDKHRNELLIVGDTIHFLNKGEWQEREHREVEVDPVFLQLSDRHGHLMDRSPNLKAARLTFDTTATGRAPLNASLRGAHIRQLQLPLSGGRAPIGYLLAAISSEDAQHVIQSLAAVLLGSFPVVVLVLFGIARLLAGRSIAPIAQITATTNRITRTNLSERIALPPRPDELHTLATSINGLLQRIEQAVEREKQFTADASHELRTPLAVLKGTLEVLIRKPRSAAEYVENIALGIHEIDRLTHLVDQLLLLARFENHAKSLNRQELSVLTSIHDVLHRQRDDLRTQHIRLDVRDDETAAAPPITSDPYLVDLILDNLLANAIKYSAPDSTINVSLHVVPHGLRCVIADQGIGIRPDELDRIFDPLYRSDALQHKEISGTGLGLSIVAKACALLDIQLSVQSELGKGTAFTLDFPMD
jgi:two-component system, OmpR family, heavy metal sensor histidine kinase CusS